MPYWCILLLDCLTIYVVTLVVFLVFQGKAEFIRFFNPLTATAIVYILVDVVFFRVFHTYSGILRFSSFVDLRRVAYAMMCGLFVIVVAKQFFHSEAILMPVRYREIFAIAFISTFFMWAIRVLVKALYDVDARIERDASGVSVRYHAASAAG